MRTSYENDNITIFCDCCGSRIGWIQGDCLVIKRKHHGEQHTSVLPIENLLNLKEAEEIRKRVRAISL